MADQGGPQAVNSGQDLLPVLKHLENSGDADQSHQGAIGAYQIMPGVARAYGVDPKDLYKPEVNEKVATQLANDLWKRYNGNVEDVLAAWNAGPRRANRWIASGRQGYLPAETRGFLSRASQYVQIGGQQMRNVQTQAAPPSDLEPGADKDG